ncbi:MAG TPA: hypothetical protein VN647_11280, partial [Nitrospira sp.]|nr:hypothetical protein [Nitrospira sp.]
LVQRQPVPRRFQFLEDDELPNSLVIARHRLLFQPGTTQNSEKMASSFVSQEGNKNEGIF